MENQTGNVKTADTSTQEEESKPEVVPFQIPKKAIALAKSVGIDLNVIVGEFQRLNERVENTEKAIGILAETNMKLQPLVELAERAKAAQAAAASGQGQAQGQGMQIPTGLMQILPALLSGGGGGDSMMQQMMQRVFEKSIQGMDLSNALTKAMIIKLAPELAESLTRGLVKKE